jgi:hypothetical protein
VATAIPILFLFSKSPIGTPKISALCILIRATFMNGGVMLGQLTGRSKSARSVSFPCFVIRHSGETYQSRGWEGGLCHSGQIPIAGEHATILGQHHL